MRGLLAFAVVSAVCLSSGCGGKNPSFPLSQRRALEELEAMREDPKPLRRPLMIVAGWGDPGFADANLFKKMAPCLDDDRIARVNFEGTDTFEQCRERLVGAVDDAFGPGDAPEQTVEVDVVANSMGGLIAVYAADRDGPGRRLKMARLFALSSPFQGATMAKVPTDNQLLIDMRPGSAFLEELWGEGKSLDYEVYPYVRIGDTWVGVEYTAPPGEHPWWVPNAPFEPAHITAFTDVRIRADVLRRLRGEPAYTTLPRTPPPAD